MWNTRLDDQLEEHVRKRGTRYLQPIIKRDLARYYQVLNGESIKLHSMFSDAEWAVMLNALRTTFINELQSPLWQVLDHCFNNKRFKVPKGVDARALLSKIGLLSTAQQYTMLDAIERWWIKSTTEKMTVVNPFKLDE